MDKKELIEELKVMLKEEGKEHLMEFAEELAFVGIKAVKVIVEKSENKIDDVVFAALEGVLKEAADKIDGEDDK